MYGPEYLEWLEEKWAREQFEAFLESLHPDDVEIVERVLRKRYKVVEVRDDPGYLLWQMRRQASNDQLCGISSLSAQAQAAQAQLTPSPLAALLGW